MNLRIDFSDDIDFLIDYCESGSKLTIINKGQTISIDAMPPAKLELLKRKLDEEIAKGARLSCLTQERKKKGPVELPLHPEGM